MVQQLQAGGPEQGADDHPMAPAADHDQLRAVRDTDQHSRGAVVRHAHEPVGRASFTPDQLAANVATLVDAVQRAKPTGAKGTYMRSLTVAPTMGPGVRVDIPSALAAANA